MRVFTKTAIFWLLLSSIVVSNSAASAEVWHSSTIMYVYPLSDGSVVLVFTQPAPLCSATTKYHYIRVGENYVTADGLKHMFAVALAAAASRQTVQAAFDSSSSYCYINRLLAIYE